ncbi:MAG: peroxiredoxin [Bacteroidota bacterium]
MATEIGQKAPDFSLTDYEGNSKSLADFKGKNVVLAFYPAAFTGVCTKEMCTFQDSLSQFNNLNAEVIGVSTDKSATNKDFAAKNNVTFPLMSDEARKTIHNYDIEFENFGTQGNTVAKRSVFVIDTNGDVQYQWIADNPGQEPNYEEVLKAVEGLKK